MIYLKFFLFSIITYILLIFSTYYLYFDDYTNEIIKEQKEISNIKFNLFKNSIEEPIRNNKIAKISSQLEKINNTNLFTYINLDYIDYYVTTNSILSHANEKTPISWYINDVSIDSKYGEIQQINVNTYKIINSNKDVFKNLIKIKSQATNQHIIKNIISTIDYKLPNYKNKNNQSNKTIKKYLQIDNKINTDFIFINNVNKIAKIEYKLNINVLYVKIYNQLLDIFLFISILYIILLICIFLFNYIMVQNNISRTISKLIIYTNDIINNNYYKFNYKKLPYKNTRKLSLNISLLSKKMAAVVNELNINKNILESKISTDALTNLPNSKMLNNDLKTLFLIKDSAYIIKIKLEYLKEFASKEDETSVNTLILNFVAIINNTINNMLNNNSIKLYRLYGADFMIIYNSANYDDIEKFSKDLKINVKSDLLVTNTNITKIYHLISFPFDKYSNTKNILDKSKLLYQDTLNFDKKITNYIEKNQELEKKNSELERVITSIIKTNSFSLSYKFDTFSYEKNELIMQEVSANLLNFDGTNIPIGTFISVAEENDLAIDFDKQLIIKTFEYIKNNNIKHQLAINISIDALKNDEFVFWLESQMLFEYNELMKNVVFSITSFAAKNFFSNFLDFTSQIKKFDGQILLKRFSYDDFSQEQLEQLSIDYIRVHKDYTNNIDKHKKSILNNIKNYCMSSNIYLLGDIVSSEHDNEILKSLNFYGTSK